MFNRSAVRNLGIFTYCQILARQTLPNGAIPCVYCGIELTRDPQGFTRYDGDPDDAAAFEAWSLQPDQRDTQRNVDHIDNDPTNTDPTNLVACCSECNHAAGNATGPYKVKRLAERLRLLDLDPRELKPRIEEVRRLPLPDKDDPEVVGLAVDWFGARIIQQRKAAAKRAGRPYNGPRSLDALRDEYDARGVEADDDTTEDAPF